jgi:hypothetical protein
MKRIASLVVSVLLTACSSFSLNQTVTLNRYSTRTETRVEPTPSLAQSALVIPANSQQPLTRVEITETTTRQVENAQVVGAPTAPPKPTVVLCPTYNPPSLPKVPALPYKELEALGPNQPQKVDDLELRHIDELRQYVTRLRATIVKSHQRYLEACRDHLQKPLK